MVMPKEEHEKILAELLDGEIEHTRRTELLQQLRADYTGVHTDFEELNQKTAKYEKENNDLVKANSMLFRQAGLLDRKDDDIQVEEKKEFSETVTIEDLTK